MQDESLTAPPGEFSRAIRRQPGKDLLGFTLKTSLTALTIFLVFLIYSSNLDGPFLFDDGSNITNNSAIRLTRLSWSGLKEAATNSPLSNRPLAYISFALNYYFHSYRYPIARWRTSVLPSIIIFTVIVLSAIER
jgi:hypothetical protein